MASYKVDIVSRLGKFHAAFYEAGGSKPDPTDSPAQDTIEDIWKSVVGEIEKLGLDEDNDSVIFRGLAYDDFALLQRQIKMSNY